MCMQGWHTMPSGAVLGCHVSRAVDQGHARGKPHFFLGTMLLKPRPRNVQQKTEHITKGETIDVGVEAIECGLVHQMRQPLLIIRSDQFLDCLQRCNACTQSFDECHQGKRHRRGLTLAGADFHPLMQPGPRNERTQMPLPVRRRGIRPSLSRTGEAVCEKLLEGSGCHPIGANLRAIRWRINSLSVQHSPREARHLRSPKWPRAVSAEAATFYSFISSVYFILYAT